jgi:hypothetical protein
MYARNNEIASKFITHKNKPPIKVPNLLNITTANIEAQQLKLTPPFLSRNFKKYRKKTTKERIFTKKHPAITPKNTAKEPDFTKNYPVKTPPSPQKT